EFRGFAFVKKIEWGDDSAPTKVTRNFYHTGAPDDEDNDGDGAFDERGFENETEEQPLKGRRSPTQTAGPITPITMGNRRRTSRFFKGLITPLRFAGFTTSKAGP
ncbi:MAG: hypothetical protein GY765_13200, partial [bacterium]|nr:hypothetical protein [bacterium]